MLFLQHVLLQQLDTGFANKHGRATSAQILETDVPTARAVTETGSLLAVVVVSCGGSYMNIYQGRLGGNDFPYLARVTRSLAAWLSRYPPLSRNT